MAVAQSWCLRVLIATSLRVHSQNREQPHKKAHLRDQVYPHWTGRRLTASSQRMWRLTTQKITTKELITKCRRLPLSDMMLSAKELGTGSMRRSTKMKSTRSTAISKWSSNKKSLPRQINSLSTVVLAVKNLILQADLELHFQKQVNFSKRLLSKKKSLSQLLSQHSRFLISNKTTSHCQKLKMSQASSMSTVITSKCIWI